MHGIMKIKYHEEFEKSKMGAPGGEGGELERCNSQEGANYRRTVEQPPSSHQQSHHAQPSNLGDEQEERDIVVYHQQSSQQPASQSCGYKEPAAPVSIQHSAPTGGGKRFRAVYDYSAADEDEISFQDGDTIINVQQIDDGWMYGTVERTGDTGMLPANYVEAM
ncbi:LIM and SH3 domain protein 1-like [Crotalus adamanteus]|uniref:LIM and SH3 domain protein 1-like n=1 Tax=Crotalus adamanteus TaxID=8729 RepID=A0AAW1B155_CROAD